MFRKGNSRQGQSVQHLFLPALVPQYKAKVFDQWLWKIFNLSFLFCVCSSVLCMCSFTEMFITAPPHCYSIMDFTFDFLWLLRGFHLYFILLLCLHRWQIISAVCRLTVRWALIKVWRYFCNFALQSLRSRTVSEQHSVFNESFVTVWRLVSLASSCQHGFPLHVFSHVISTPAESLAALTHILHHRKVWQQAGIRCSWFPLWWWQITGPSTFTATGSPTLTIIWIITRSNMQQGELKSQMVQNQG